jgi:hypothetical protein
MRHLDAYWANVDREYAGDGGVTPSVLGAKSSALHKRFRAVNAVVGQRPRSTLLERESNDDRVGGKIQACTSPCAIKPIVTSSSGVRSRRPEKFRMFRRLWIISFRISPWVYGYSGGLLRTGSGAMFDGFDSESSHNLSVSMRRLHSIGVTEGKDERANSVNSSSVRVGIRQRACQPTCAGGFADITIIPMVLWYSTDSKGYFPSLFSLAINVGL